MRRFSFLVYFFNMVFVHTEINAQHSSFMTVKGSYTLNTPIRTQGKGNKNQLFSLIYTQNSNIDKDILIYIVNTYIQECNRESINYDIAFAQMALETNFLRYGNIAQANQNNFAGIGVINKSQKGSFFSTILIGIRAHIQHLSAYTHKEKLKTSVVDPRFQMVHRGIAPCIKDLSGRWAYDKQYSVKILNLANRIQRISPEKLQS